MPQTIHPGEAEAQYIHRAARFAEQLPGIHAQLITALDGIESNLLQLKPADNAPALESIRARCTRLHELRNMMELGSFSLQVKRALDAAWQRLP